MESYLCIPDLQIPFNHHRALEFCKYLKKHYKIKDENVINLGDETDQYFGSLFKKDPDGLYSARTEIEQTVETLKLWYEAFPVMKLVLSNHGSRWIRKAADAEIPSQLLRKYEEWIQAPEGWKWRKNWIIEASKDRFMVEHGDDYGGSAHIQMALHNGMSTICGHHHSKAVIDHFTTNNKRMWAVISGCLIDFEQYAFHYARKHPKKPVIGATVIMQGGRMPVFIPLE